MHGCTRSGKVSGGPGALRQWSVGSDQWPVGSVSPRFSVLAFKLPIGFADHWPLTTDHFFVVQRSVRRVTLNGSPMALFAGGLC